MHPVVDDPVRSSEPLFPVPFETQCRNFVYRFYERYDQADYAALVDMFTPDGSWFRANQALNGRAAILAALQQRPAHRRSLHAVNNLQVMPSSPSQCELRYWLTVLRSDQALAPDEPASIRSATMVLSGSAQIVLRAGELRFTRKQLKREFLFTPA